tara:strand:+ start:84 stop:383 length:300 start_codon:yes stop_codon:yes gene_type:complete
MGFNKLKVNGKPFNILDLIELKLSKKAFIQVSSGIFTINHYGTTILSHDFNKNTTKINFNCSKTSDQQIYRALAILKIELENCINVHIGKKYNESGVNE